MEIVINNVVNSQIHFEGTTLQDIKPTVLLSKD